MHYARREASRLGAGHKKINQNSRENPEVSLRQKLSQLRLNYFTFTWGQEKKISFRSIIEKTVRTGEYCGQDRQMTYFKHKGRLARAAAELFCGSWAGKGGLHEPHDHGPHAFRWMGKQRQQYGDGVEWEYPNIVGLEVQNFH
ncbi:hypothetical protein BgiBS90_018878 [Biomphalaria glabrata]|nr:hypothetical protein BgiBS90_018878 [Biomphalaria glabrata]